MAMTSNFFFSPGVVPDIEGLEHNKIYQIEFLKEYLVELARIDKTDEPVTDKRIEGIYNIMQVMIMVREAE
jgi:hypothetical protein